MPQTAPTRQTDSPIMADRLLAWYDRHHRDLPWRIAPQAALGGAQADPYRVWLSEIMLQQTTVSAVKPYFANFLERWPNVAALAAAPQDEVMKAWAGLGYYSRARNLKKCAETVMRLHGGAFPDTEDELLSLPGVGPYTAAAIAAIAFGRRAVVMDGNVERVIARFYAIASPLPEAKREIREKLAPLTPGRRAGDFAQAMMDLGATICTPKRPSCIICPLRGDCRALAGADPELYPVKPAKTVKPVRRGAVFVARRADGAVLLEKRSERGLLGGMAGPPTTGWTARIDGETGAGAAPFTADWLPAGAVSHVFTHFELRLDVWRAEVADVEPQEGQFWSSPDQLAGEALPTLFKKAIETALPGALKPKRP